MDYTYYGTLADADEYFEHRLHAYAWSGTKKEKALWAATQIIDTLNFKGSKATVFALSSDATKEEIQAADLSQPRQFPRGSDTTVPDDIKIACYELAYSLLDGRDPERELENLGVTSRAISSVRTTYHRNQVPIEHLISGVPNALAWRYLRPYLRDNDTLIVQRIS
jgi:hypothetical protein